MEYLLLCGSIIDEIFIIMWLDHRWNIYYYVTQSYVKYLLLCDSITDEIFIIL
jgi:hypothetical protein